MHKVRIETGPVKTKTYIKTHSIVEKMRSDIGQYI